MTAVAPSLRPAPTLSELPRIDAAVRAVALRVFSSIRNGELEIVEDGGLRHRFGSMATFPVRAVLRVHRASFYRSLLRGSIGAARSYAEGAWDCDDLVAVVRLAIRNLDTLDRVQAAINPLLRPLRNAGEWLHRNTRERSRENIGQHYDIGNDLFELMLDDTMSYSSGIFESAHSTLHEASIAKIDRLCRKLQLGPSDHLVEIGSGWGGLAVYAAQTYGCRVTTTTISTEQHRLARERVRRHGVEDRVTVLLEDYRDLRGRFTKLVSVEMIEAIGWRYFGTYFEVCNRLLTADGLAAIQAICQPHRSFLATRGTSTFINAHVFPGGICPSLESLIDAAEKSDLQLVDLEDITSSYPLTLAAWRANFLGNAGRLDPRFDERFRRFWVLYLSLCEAGFTERRISDVQLLFAKAAFPADRLPRWAGPAGAAAAVAPSLESRAPEVALH
ncbi:MAG: class I SAM-dependent methyltransferase [Candidatus Dormibacteraeota bacterium]|uniref:Class I SAM-dependent methyltransferase n=1 Tax=Candidatus Aeolococcus gillhamiae TaxID=3127015 RepID=A0A934N546_9BACT|nr:class I SAM-dependent methyltransferase [Candidatus Dormibacteraeota bacterium]